MTGHDPHYPLEQLLRMLEASTQIALQRKEAILHVSGCSRALNLYLALGRGRWWLCLQRCVLMEDLCHEVKLLWKDVSRPLSITDDEKEIDWIFSETLQIEEPESTAVLRERQAESVVIGLGKEDDWQLVTSGKRRKVDAPPADLQLQNEFISLAADERLLALCKRVSELAKSEPHRSTRKKR